MEKRLYDYNLDDNLEIYLLIASVDVRLAKNGKKFLALTFQDKSGKMDGKFWDASDTDIETYTVGSIVALAGKRELYQGKPQLKIFSMRLTQSGEPQDPSFFMESAPENIEQMKKEFNRYIFDINNPSMNRIVKALMKKYQDSFFKAPAAKRLHHAYSGGLAYHTLSILRLAESVVSHYPQVNVSLLYAGAILHDLGKLREITGVVNTEYTLEGNLLGHIVIIDEEISHICRELSIDESKEEVLLLKHMVLSHHGLLEYGSPVRPRLLEAEILHTLDNLDASITQISDALTRTEAGSFGEPLYGLENRNFYKPQMADYKNE